MTGYNSTVSLLSVSVGASPSKSGRKIDTIKDFTYSQALQAPPKGSKWYVCYYPNGDVYTNEPDTTKPVRSDLSIGDNFHIGVYKSSKSQSKEVEGAGNDDETAPLIDAELPGTVQFSELNDIESIASITLYSGGAYKISKKHTLFQKQGILGEVTLESLELEEGVLP